MINFLKKNLLLLISIVALIIILLVTFALIASYGQELYITNLISEIIGNFPFAYFLLPKISMLTGLNISIPTINVTVFVDIAKALLLTLLHSVIGCVLYTLFLKLPKAVDSTDLSGAIDDVEKFMKSPLYVIANILIQCISILTSITAAYFLSAPILTVVLSFESEAVRFIVGLILLIITIFLYSAFYSWFAKIKMSMAVAKTAMFNLIPKTLDAFITSSLWIAFYLTFSSESSFFAKIAVILLIIVWLVISEKLTKNLRMLTASIHNAQKKKRFDINTLLGMIFIYCLTICATLSPVISGDSQAISNNPFLNWLYSFPFIPSLFAGDSVTSLVTEQFSYFIYELLKLVILGFMCGLMQRYIRSKNLIIWYLVQCTIVCVTIALYTLIINLFGMNDKLIMFMVLCIIAIFCLFLSDLTTLFLQAFIMSIFFVLVYTLIHHITGGATASITVLITSAVIAPIVMISMFVINYFSD